MSRIGTLLLGVVLGGAGVYVGLKYHVVRAEDGFHFVPKMKADFTQAYVDIRQFDVGNWNSHRELAVAIVKADKGHLIQESADESLRQAVDGVIHALSGKS